MYECMKLKCVCNVGVSVSVPENPLSLSLSVRVLANVRHLIFSWELERFHDFQTLCQMLERIRLWNPSKCALIIYTTDRIWSEIHEQTITINAILLIVFMRVFTLPPFPQSPKISSYHILRRFSFFFVRQWTPSHEKICSGGGSGFEFGTRNIRIRETISNVGEWFGVLTP